MSSMALLLFQLSALVPCLLGQTFPGLNDDFYHPGDDSFGYWNQPQRTYADLDQEASFNSPQNEASGVFGKEFLNGPSDYNSDIGRDVSQRQFPFFFPNNQLFPGFPWQPQAPQIQQQQQLPPPFLNFPQFSTPWWQGDNVCVEKDESTDDWTGNEVGLATQPDYSINVQTCAEQKNQYICKTTTNRNGKKLTIVSTRQCCQGYSRFPQRHGPNTACVKIEMVSYEEAANKYGYPDFYNNLKMTNISRDQVQQSTLLLPLRPMDMSNSSKGNDSMADIDVNESSFENSIFAEDIQEYLIPNKTIDLEEIENESVFLTESGHSIRFNVYPRASKNQSGHEFKYQYTANCVPVLKPKIFATEGMVLGLEKKLIVAESNLLDLLRERDDLSMFTEMIESFNLTDFLSDHGGLTVLAPNNDAFANMSHVVQRMLTSGDECASDYVSSHILGLTLCSSAVVMKARAHVQNILKQTLTFERNSNDEMVINHIAKAIEEDLMATNGVLHVVDKALPSDQAMTVMSLLMNRNSTIFADLLLKSGFIDQFEDLRGVTFFVPTDKALESSPWKQALDNDANSLMKNTSLYDFLANHVVERVIGSFEFRTGLVKTMAKQELKMNLIVNHPSAGSSINCAKFVSTDNVSCNRAVHQIDRSLDVPKMFLLEALEANKEYSKFLGIIKQGNLTHLINNTVNDLTLLVPTNDVFEEQKEYYEELMHPNTNKEAFLRMHMIASTCCSAIPKYPLINTVQSVNGIPLVMTRHRRPMIANAHVTKCDVLQKNGVIFEINDIIEIKPAVAQRSAYFK